MVQFSQAVSDSLQGCKTMFSSGLRSNGTGVPSYGVRAWTCPVAVQIVNAKDFQEVEELDLAFTTYGLNLSVGLSVSTAAAARAPDLDSLLKFAS